MHAPTLLRGRMSPVPTYYRVEGATLRFNFMLSIVLFWWDFATGLDATASVCDANGDPLAEAYGCDCTGCACNNCTTYRIDMAAVGEDCDGWGGALLSIHDCFDNTLSSFVTLFSGNEGATSECLSASSPDAPGYIITVTEGATPDVVSLESTLHVRRTCCAHTWCGCVRSMNAWPDNPGFGSGCAPQGAMEHLRRPRLALWWRRLPRDLRRLP